MEEYKSKFSEANENKSNDFRVTFIDSGDRSVGIPSVGDEIFVIFRNGNWPEDFISGLKEDIVKWCQDVSGGKFEHKVTPIENSALNSVISKIPEERLPSQEDWD